MANGYPWRPLRSYRHPKQGSLVRRPDRQPQIFFGPSSTSDWGPPRAAAPRSSAKPGCGSKSWASRSGALDDRPGRGWLRCDEEVTLLLGCSLDRFSFLEQERFAGLYNWILYFVQFCTWFKGFVWITMCFFSVFPAPLRVAYPGPSKPMGLVRNPRPLQSIRPMTPPEDSGPASRLGKRKGDLGEVQEGWKNPALWIHCHRTSGSILLGPPTPWRHTKKNFELRLLPHRSDLVWWSVDPVANKDSKHHPRGSLSIAVSRVSYGGAGGRVSSSHPVLPQVQWVCVAQMRETLTLGRPVVLSRTHRTQTASPRQKARSPMAPFRKLHAHIPSPLKLGKVRCRNPKTKRSLNLGQLANSPQSRRETPFVQPTRDAWSIGRDARRQDLRDIL